MSPVTRHAVAGSIPQINTCTEGLVRVGYGGSGVSAEAPQQRLWSGQGAVLGWVGRAGRGSQPELARPGQLFQQTLRRDSRALARVVLNGVFFSCVFRQYLNGD